MQENNNYSFRLSGKAIFRFNAGKKIIKYSVSPIIYKEKVSVKLITLGNTDLYYNVYEFYNKSDLTIFISLYDENGLIKKI